MAQALIASVEVLLTGPAVAVLALYGPQCLASCSARLYAPPRRGLVLRPSPLSPDRSPQPRGVR